MIYEQKPMLINWEYLRGNESHLNIKNNLDIARFAHYHDFFEIFLVSEGNIIHKINGEKHHLREGNLVFIRPDDVHSFSEIHNNKFQLINLEFPRQVLKNLFSYLSNTEIQDALLKSIQPKTVLLNKIETSTLKERLIQLNCLPFSDQYTIGLHLRSILCKVFIEYFFKTEMLTHSSIPGWFVELCDLMRRKENFTGGINTLLQLSGKSHGYICKCFCEYLNTTPVKFINSLKLNYAANLLTTTDYEIIDIAMESGFDSLSHFYHIFKDSFHVSPQKLRNDKKSKNLFCTDFKRII